MSRGGFVVTHVPRIGFREFILNIGTVLYLAIWFGDGTEMWTIVFWFGRIGARRGG